MKKLFAFIITAVFSINANALVIDLISNQNQINIGDQLEVQIHTSNLFASSLGDYDVNLHYDANLLNVTGIQWGDSTKGNQLDIDGFGSLHDSNNATAGLLNVFELSFDNVWDLENLQADNFTLFSVLFSSITSGTANFTLDVNAIGDAYGNALKVEGINTTSVSINSTKLPEPSSVFLLAGGLIILLLRKAK